MAGALADERFAGARDHARDRGGAAPRHALRRRARPPRSLRFATIQEFLARPDGLPGLQRAYGGFRFATVRTYDIALKYRALLEGHADVASAFTTDGEVASDHLVDHARRPQLLAGV